jgi:hypothetical protein
MSVNLGEILIVYSFVSTEESFILRDSENWLKFGSWWRVHDCVFHWFKVHLTYMLVYTNQVKI